MDWFPETNAPKRRRPARAAAPAEKAVAGGCGNADAPSTFAEIVPFDGGGRAYTYRVPAKFEGKIAPGSLVKIPLGRRINFGVVWKMNAVPAESWREKVRDIAELCFDVPVLTPDTLRLCEWISAYYAAPFNSVLQTILPATVRRGVRPVVEKKIALARELSEEELQKLRRRAPKQARLYEILKQRADAAKRASAGTPPPAP